MRRIERFEMLFTVFGFAMLALLWNKMRKRARALGIGAFADPARIPDAASSIVSYAGFILSSYGVVIGPGFVFNALPGDKVLFFFIWAFVAVFGFIALFVASSKVKYLNMGPVNGRLNRIAALFGCGKTAGGGYDCGCRAIEKTGKIYKQ